MDIKRAKIVRFRAYSEGQAWATAPYERHGNPPSGRYPLVIAMVEADDELAHCAAPEAAATGDYYARMRLPQ